MPKLNYAEVAAEKTAIAKATGQVKDDYVPDVERINPAQRMEALKAAAGKRLEAKPLKPGRRGDSKTSKASQSGATTTGVTDDGSDLSDDDTFVSALQKTIGTSKQAAMVKMLKVKSRMNAATDIRGKYELRKAEAYRELSIFNAERAKKIEEANEARELALMIAEEKRTWDAYELNARNYDRLVREAKENTIQAALRADKLAEERESLQEEGLLYDHGVAVAYKRWRASPELTTTLGSHPCQILSVAVSKCCRYVCTGGEDGCTKLWDTKAFSERLKNPRLEESNKVQKKRVAAAAALGWNCVVTLIPTQRTHGFAHADTGQPLPGVTSALRGLTAVHGVNLHPQFCSHEKRPQDAVHKTGAIPSPLHMLATVSADGYLRIWDLCISVGNREPIHNIDAHPASEARSCCFTPGKGDRIATGGSDCSVQLYDVSTGCLLFTFRGHHTTVMCVAFSPNGRYLASCSDFPENGIKIWYADAPIYDTKPRSVGLRLRWSRSGVIKRVVVTEEVTQFFLTNQEDSEKRESSDESDSADKVHGSPDVSILSQCSSQPLADAPISSGFSIALSYVDENGGLSTANCYHRGCKIVVRLRGLNRFQGFFIGAGSSEGLAEQSFDKCPVRYGFFLGSSKGGGMGAEGRVLPGIQFSSKRRIAYGSDLEHHDGGVNEVVLTWKAPNRFGAGWVTFHATMRYRPVPPRGSKVIPPMQAHTVWITLKEIPPPVSLKVRERQLALKKPHKRSYSTVHRTEMFASALQKSDWKTVSGLLSEHCRLDMTGSKSVGYTAALGVLRGVMGDNITYRPPLSTGVCWTSVEIWREKILEKVPEEPKNVLQKKEPARGTTVITTDVSVNSSMNNEKKGVKRRISDTAEVPEVTPEEAPERSAELSAEEQKFAAALADQRKFLENILLQQAKKELASLPELLEAGAGDLLGELARTRHSAEGVPENSLKESSAKRTGKGGVPLVWGGMFGCDLPHLRMKLPGTYPTDPTIKYDIMSDDEGGGGAEDAEMIAAIQAVEADRRTPTIGQLQEAGLQMEERKKRVAMRRRRALVEPQALGYGRDPSTDVQPIAPMSRKGGLRPAKVDRLIVNFHSSDKLWTLEDQKHAVDMPMPLDFISKNNSAEQEKNDPGKKILEKNVPSGKNSTEKVAVSGSQNMNNIIVKPSVDAHIRTNTSTDANINTTSNEAPVNKTENLQLNLQTPAGDHVEVGGTVGVGGTRVGQNARRGAAPILPGLGSLDSPERDTGKLANEAERLLAKSTGGLLRDLRPRSTSISQCHQSTVNFISWSPDGARLASAGSDGFIKLWDPLRGYAVHNTQINTKPDGRENISSAVDMTKNDVNLSGVSGVGMLNGGHEGGALTVNWSEDGHHLISGGVDRACMVWSVTTLQPIRSLLGHTDVVTSATFVPKMNLSASKGGSDQSQSTGMSIVTCSGDGTVRVWTLCPVVPGPPQQPTSGAIGKTSIVLRWEPPAAGAESLAAYHVSWRLGNSPEYLPADEESMAPDTPQREIVPLLAGTVYYFRVCATNRVGRGAWSEESEPIGTLVDRPMAVDRPMVEAVYDTRILISFLAPIPTLPSMQTSCFDVHCSGGGMSMHDSPFMTVTWDACVARGEEFLKTLKGPPTGSHKRDHFVLLCVEVMSLEPGIPYRFAVSGINTQGKGDLSAATYSTVTQSVTPKPPCKLTVEPILGSTSALRVSWAWNQADDGGAAVNGFVLRRRDARAPESINTGTMQGINVVPKDLKCKRTDLSRVIDNLAAGSWHTFQLCAFNAIGRGEWSDTTEPCRVGTAPPDAPPPPAVLECLSARVKLHLVPPLIDNGDPVVAYALQCREHSTFSQPVWRTEHRIPIPPPPVLEHKRISAELSGSGTFSKTPRDNPKRSSRDLFGESSRELSASGELSGSLRQISRELSSSQELSSSRKFFSSSARAGGAIDFSGGTSLRQDYSSRSSADLSSSGALRNFLEVDTWYLGLQPMTHYSFRVAAINVMGRGVWSGPSNRVRMNAPAPPMMETAPTIEWKLLNEGGVECEVGWSLMDFNGATIEEINIEYKPYFPELPRLNDPAPRISFGGIAIQIDEFVNGDDEVDVPDEKLLSVMLKVAEETQAAIIRGLILGAMYVFRVRGSSVAGWGEFSPWTEPVTVPRRQRLSD